jgi:hypothetical protein
MAAKKSKKKKASTGKAAATKKAAPKKAASKPNATPKKQAAAKSESFQSAHVSMSHVFALRPRAIMAFRPDDFRRAKQLLEEEAYKAIHEAARAVAEKALELTQGGPDGVPKQKRH